MATHGEYWDGEYWRTIEEGMVLTDHFGKTNLHPISECTNNCPQREPKVDYCPCCGREV